MVADPEYLLDGLSEDTKDFWVDRSVPILHNPTAAQFLREAVCRYHPVLITGLTDHWPAINKWSKEYLVRKLSDRKININLTADGHGDCVKDVYKTSDETELVSREPYFVYPAEHDMTISDFFNLLEHKNVNGEVINGNNVPVPYLSQQNDNLRQNMPELLNDIQTTLPLATEAFGSSGTSILNSGDNEESGVVSGSLEAVNLWIGDERSVSSIHKDHYENMYAVVRGEKTFTLLPPTDVAYLQAYTKEYPTLRYAVRGTAESAEAAGGEKSEFDTDGSCYFENAADAFQHQLGTDRNIVSDGISDITVTDTPQLQLVKNGCPSETLEWISLDPEDPQVLTKYPLFRRASPLRVTVLPGQVLYIPAMWYHRVSQNCLTVSVNYWYDQKFDFRFVFYQSIKRLHSQADKKKIDGAHI